MFPSKPAALYITPHPLSLNNGIEGCLHLKMTAKGVCAALRVAGGPVCVSLQFPSQMERSAPGKWRPSQGYETGMTRLPAEDNRGTEGLWDLRYNR